MMILAMPVQLKSTTHAAENRGVSTGLHGSTANPYCCRFFFFLGDDVLGSGGGPVANPYLSNILL
jgi:hypothetical protein